jgi:hypothetical protein
MTQALHARPYLSLEDRRDVAHQQDTNLNSARLAFADELYSLLNHWRTANGNSSTREFIQWFCFGEYQARYYSYLRAGMARTRHQWPDSLRLGELADIGAVLESGRTVGDVVAMFNLSGMEGVRALKPKRDTTHFEIPTSVAPAVRDVVRSLSETDSPSAEQNAAALLALGSLPDSLQRAALAMHETGQDLTSALISAEDKAANDHAWLSRQPCFVPQCGMPSAELHHLKLQGTRFRTQDVLIPTCLRHHQAQPGLHSVAAHASNQDEWIARFWPSQEAFWQSLAALYAERLFGGN